jgi:lipopolysaccharide transport system permease protein
VTILVESLSELNRYRHLLKTWSMREIKIRYKQSFLGGLWAILQPLSVALIFSVIFSLFITVPTDGVPHLIFYYAALFPWTFFATSVTTGSNSLITNMHLVTKIYFPREIMPLASMIAALFDFAIAGLIYFGFALVYQVQFGPSLILLPVLVLIQVIFTTGVVLTLAALNVFYRDIRFVVPLGLQLFMYVTPIIYPVSVIPDRLLSLYMLNPMASLIDAYRVILIHGQWPDPVFLGSALLVSVILFIAAYIFFGRAARSFADLI